MPRHEAFQFELPLELTPGGGCGSVLSMRISKARSGFRHWLNQGQCPGPESSLKAVTVPYQPKILDMVTVRPCLLFKEGGVAQVLAYDYASDRSGNKSLVYLCYTDDDSVVRVQPDEISGPADGIVPFLVKSIR